MPDTMRGRSQGLTPSLSGRNFRSCLQATKTCGFPSLRGGSDQGEGADLCTQGKFFKMSQWGCSAEKRMALPSYSGETHGLRVAGSQRAMYSNGRWKSACVWEWERERKGRRGATKSSLSDIEPFQLLCCRSCSQLLQFNRRAEIILAPCVCPLLLQHLLQIHKYTCVSKASCHHTNTHKAKPTLLQTV